MNNFIFDLQRFADSKNPTAFDTIKLIGGIVSSLGLKPLMQELKDDLEGVKSTANPILKFIGSFLYKEADDLDYNQSSRKTMLSSYATIITGAVEIADDALTVVLELDSKNKDTSKIASSVASISKNLGFMGTAVANLNSLNINKKNSKLQKLLPFVAIVTSGVSLVANEFTTLDGLTEDEKLELQKSYLAFTKTLSTELVKEVLSDAVANELSKIGTNGITFDVIKKNATFFNEASKTITKSIGIIFSLGTNILTGINKFNSTLKTYTADGIPEDMAKRDAFIDALTVVIHGLATYYTKGLDDLAFTGTRQIVSWITGKEIGAYTKDKNYVEVVTDLLKAFNYTNTGTDNGETLVSFVNDTMVYGAGGDDNIINVASGVTIYGGHDNDTIASRVNAEDNSTPQNNSILGGPGKVLYLVLMI